MLEDSNPDWVIETKNLSKMYGPHLALDGLNLQIPRGAVGVLGPNGAGKSTLLHLHTRPYSNYFRKWPGVRL